MILKIKVPNGSWSMHGGIQDVRFGVGGPIRYRHLKDGSEAHCGFERQITWHGKWAMPSDEKYTFFCPDVMMSTVPKAGPPRNREPGDKGETSPVAWLIATRSDGTERVFVFDGAFLLNDEGKTIEHMIR